MADTTNVNVPDRDRLICERIMRLVDAGVDPRVAQRIVCGNECATMVINDLHEALMRGTHGD